MESDCGGNWGGMLKSAGFDGLIITGKADVPVLLVIENGAVEIREAGTVWGMDTFETYSAVRAMVNEKAEVACIGPAGENLVRFASIMTDGEHARTAARGGVGTIMGWKNLKAVSVYGEKKPEVADPEGLLAFRRRRSKKMVDDSQVLTDYGTSLAVDVFDEIGDLPIRNWHDRRFEGAGKISGQAMADSILTGKYGCGDCVVRCGRIVEIKDGDYPTPGVVGGPEYETIGMLGSNLMIDDIEVIAKANELCNRFGMDTISTGSIIGFAMEANDRGVLSKEDTGELCFEWGNGDGVIEIINAIVYRKGIGRIMGEGIVRFADSLGSATHEFAVHVKGLDFPAHDPRAKNGNALAYATSNRGACHLQAFNIDFEGGAACPSLGYEETFDRHSIEGKAEFIIKLQHVMSMFDSLKSCKFLIHFGMDVDSLVEAFNLVTGLSFDKEEFLKTGERIFNLKRMYNVKCGISRKDDALPPRILNLKRGEGADEDRLPCLNEMLHDYYKLRKWDEFGIPKREILTELGLR